MCIPVDAKNGEPDVELAKHKHVGKKLKVLYYYVESHKLVELHSHKGKEAATRSYDDLEITLARRKRSNSELTGFRGVWKRREKGVTNVGSEPFIFTGMSFE